MVRTSLIIGILMLLPISDSQAAAPAGLACTPVATPTRGVFDGMEQWSSSSSGGPTVVGYGAALIADRAGTSFWSLRANEPLNKLDPNRVINRSVMLNVAPILRIANSDAVMQRSSQTVNIYRPSRSDD